MVRGYSSKAAKNSLKTAKKIRAPYVDDVDIGAQIKRITGDTGVVITNKNYVESLSGQKTKHDSAQIKDVVRVTSQQQFADTLGRLKEEKKFPAVIGLEGTCKELTRGLPKQPNFADDGPQAHMLSVVDYDAAKGQAKISNQWGHAGDRWISIKHLYDATNPKTIAWPLPKAR